MRVVLDTNIFVSMLIGSEVGKIHAAWRANKFTIIVSHDIVSEYLDVLRRPKLHLAPRIVIAVLGRINRKAEFVTPDDEISVVQADPSDNKFLEAALAGKADYLVSGDKHLLELKEFRSIPMITAREFLNLLNTQNK